MTSTVSTKVIESMFNHLSASYSEDEAREILAQKYPEAEATIAVLKPTQYRVTTVQMGKVTKVTEPMTDEQVLKAAVKAKVASAPKELFPKKESKADRARALYEAAADKSRGAMIKIFMEELNMSKAAASTYFYNVKG